jgi:hypothetical protein
MDLREADIKALMKPFDSALMDACILEKNYLRSA